MYLETMQRVLPMVGQKLYVDENATGVLPLLNLDGARRADTPLTAATQRTGGGQ
jgi:hypothetical protein